MAVPSALAWANMYHETCNVNRAEKSPSSLPGMNKHLTDFFPDLNLARKLNEK